MITVANNSPKYDCALNGGFVGEIPVRNIWLLMLYASELFRICGNDRVDLDDNPDDLPDLIAQILVHAVEERQHRHLNQGYYTKEATLSRVRGRIDALKTECRQLSEQGLVACRFNELTVDTPRNRFVRGALESIAFLVKDKKLAHQCLSLARGMKLKGVSGKIPSRLQVSQERFHRNDANDKLMVSAAILAFDLNIPSETSGRNSSYSPNRDIQWFRRLFEKAVGGFYRVALTNQGWQVESGKHLAWQIEQQTSSITNILPSMQTDIILHQICTGRKIVIDTKFNAILTKGWYREQTLRSGYLFQIYAYLMSQVKNDDAMTKASGLLLHPAAGEMVDEAVIIQGHEIRFGTVDLLASVKDIRTQLLRFCVPLLK